MHQTKNWCYSMPEIRKCNPWDRSDDRGWDSLDPDSPPEDKKINAFGSEKNHQKMDSKSLEWCFWLKKKLILPKQYKEYSKRVLRSFQQQIQQIHVFIITSWWFQPVWKIFSSNWIMQPQKQLGWKSKKSLKPPTVSWSKFSPLTTTSLQSEKFGVSNSPSPKRLRD